jgi:hypothetical protein
MQAVLTGKETTMRFAGFAQTDDKTKIVQGVTKKPLFKTTEKMLLV